MLSQIASASVVDLVWFKATALLISASLYVSTLYMSNPKTFLSLIPSAILYLCNSFPNTEAVVLSFFWFSSKIGVPVNPKNIALGKVSLIDKTLQLTVSILFFFYS